MNALLELQKQCVEVGDRIVVRSTRREMVRFAGKPGTVVVVFNAPRGSCMVRVDMRYEQLELFLYQSEMAQHSTR